MAVKLSYIYLSTVYHRLRRWVLYEKKHKEQKKMYYGGAEAHKLEAIEIYVKKLSTKLSIAIHIVNATSKKINKLRDEELWFQTCREYRRPK